MLSNAVKNLYETLVFVTRAITQFEEKKLFVVGNLNYDAFLQQCRLLISWNK